MSEKVSVVTGASAGIGKEIARALAKRGHRVAIVCRDPRKTEDVLAEFGRTVPGASVEPFFADLSVMADVRRVADELRTRFRAVDVLVNNAGIQDTSPRITVDGFDRMVATNHLGPFLLTRLLLDPLKEARGRVVMVASEAHRLADDVDVHRLAEPGRYAGLVAANRAYGRTKLYNILFAQELAIQMAKDEVTANAMCPGLVASSFLREVPRLARVTRIAARTPLVNTPEQGARLAVRLAVEPGFAGRTGRFYSTTPGASRLPVTRARLDRSFQRIVWYRTADLVEADGA
ncbi:SDR family NAD(P)-dependent oxidoreductase [Actinocorallia sp. API 0066]|uniref:SDR family NAD(P)-dependent oxidoreductase n=1 Tax=Actinocorallia sp. API 0066 TaxID=2896846 RepID=UPI001E2B1E6D|nr:SDR family NAD(P)-dependent oxidoreductase [Actinocorallia sp. API 0066]MCD0449301.1 SDR family NAD(P)-dependent oxidoreductase [Actinocorallia sp. API 0066]